MECRHRRLFEGGLPWEHYRVEIVVERLTGGLPASDELLTAWMEARGAKPVTPAVVAQAADRAIDRTAAQEARTAALLEEPNGEEMAERHTVVFARDADGNLAYEGRCFFAALKEAANILKDEKLLGVKNFRSKLAERLFVCQEFCSLAQGSYSVIERPISVMTMRGPRTSIKRAEIVTNAPVSFDLHLLADGIVKPTALESMVRYACLNGFGADRSQGSGRAQLVDFVRID